MKTYEEAIENAAKHYVAMKVSHCFCKAELEAAHLAKAVVIADVYERDDYCMVETRLRVTENRLESNMDWFEGYCANTSEE